MLRRCVVPLVLPLAVLGVGPASASNSASEATPPLRATVSRVIDGDTVEARLTGGTRERVRVIGIDAPERGACYASQATAAARRLAQGKRVRLVTDGSQARRDRFGRRLAYVTLPTGQDLGRLLIARGFGRVLVVGRPFARIRAYRAAENAARRAGLGIWTACVPPEPQPPQPPPPPPPPQGADLAITKTASANPAPLGADLTYTLSVTNAGPASAADVGVVETLPATVSLVSITASQGSCITTPIVGCALGALAAGATTTATVVVRPTVAGQITNTATLQTPTPDPNTANNAAAITTMAGVPVTPPPPPPPPPPGNCAPSYPDVCIPPPPPDLDCGQIPHRNFRVIHTVPSPDPHGFDGDRDGIGCES